MPRTDKSQRRDIEGSASRLAGNETVSAVFGRAFPILAMIEFLLATHGAVADGIRIADGRARRAGGQQERETHCSHFV